MSHSINSLIAVCFGVNFLINASVNGQILSTQVLTINGNSTEQVTIFDNSENRLEPFVRFITVGLHSHKHNLTLHKSYENTNSSVTGLNIGLVLVPNEDIGYIIVTNNNSDDVNALLTISQHGDNDPVPGACNEEFPLEISPFLRLFDEQNVNRLEYQFANIGSPKGYRPIKCDKSQPLIKYEVYGYFLQENDISETEYFRSITLMTNLSNIIESSSLLTNVSTTRSYFYSYPGRGIVYNIIATSQNYSSAYVPIVTYDCNDLNDCTTHNVYGLVLVVIYGLIGLIVCLRGHFWFQTQMLFFGLIDSSFIGFLFISTYSELSITETTIYTMAIGLGFSFLWLFVWKILHIPVLSLLLSGLSLGFLLMSIILFTTIGNLDIFQNDMNYWLILCCSSILVTLFFLMVNAVVLSVVSSSIVGSYLAVVAIDRFIGGCLTFIIINVVKRAHFHFPVINSVPFQNKDIVLSILWVLLSLLGIVLQLYNAKDSTRSPFPSPTSCSHPHRERRRSERVLFDIEERRDSNRRLRNRRWNPIPSSPIQRPYNRGVDERSYLLGPHFTSNSSPSHTSNVRRQPQYGRDSPPPDYDHINSNQREYMSI